MLSNTEVAQKLLEIRTLMEMAGESFYKYMAYERAAASVENAPPLADLGCRGRASQTPRRREVDWRRDRTARAYRKNRTARTALRALSADAAGGARRERHRNEDRGMLFAEYGIASLADLEAAIAAGTLSGVPRLGSKTIENWRRGILAYRGRQRRTPLPQALAIAREAMDYVREGPPLERLTCRGKSAPRRSHGRRHRSRLHVAPCCRRHRALHRLDRVRRPCLQKGRRRRASGFRAACKSICACCPTICMETYCNISPDRASTTSSCANTPYVPVCASARTGS